MTMKEKMEWLTKEIGFVPVDDGCGVNFYYKAMHDYGMNLCDADDWAWLNTLFRYDIGAERALAITTWYYENEDCTASEAVDVTQKETLRNICEWELGYHLDFSHWPDKEPEALQYGFKEYFEEENA